MNLFLVFSPGHSGTAWFNECLNLHPKVRSLVEAHHVLPFDHNDPTSVQDQECIAFFEREATRGEFKAVGLVKSFRIGTLEYVIKNVGTIIQLIRNPIKIVDFKYTRSITGDDWQRAVAERIIGKRNVSNQEIFLGQVIRYAERYKEYLRRHFPIIKLEDLNYSLSIDREYFKTVLEYLTQIPWDDEYLIHIRDNLAPGCEDQYEDEDFFWPEERKQHRWAYDPTPDIAWRNWADWQRESFLKRFEQIMNVMGYHLS